MKKLIKIVVVLLVLLVVAVFVASFFIGSIIKTGVETVGPKVAKVPIKLDSASLSMLGGSGGMSGLVVGNPEGYKTDSAIKVGKVSLAVVPGSVLSDKIVIKSVEVRSPEITLEGGLSENNLTKIQKNIQEFTGAGGGKKGEGSADKGDKSASKKLQVDDFLISGAKVNAVILGKSITVPIPDIHFTNLGQGPEGITAGDLMTKAFNEVISEALSAVAKSATGAAGDAAKGATDSLNKATKGIGDLFKKK